MVVLRRLVMAIITTMKEKGELIWKLGSTTMAEKKSTHPPKIGKSYSVVNRSRLHISDFTYWNGLRDFTQKNRL